jgi:hypothetical protein
MSSVVRKLRFIDGAVREVTDETPLAAAGSSIGFLGGAYNQSRPLLQNSLGISCPTPERLKEARDFIHARNIQGVEIRDDGSCYVTDARGRKEYMTARGLVDYSSYGGVY